MGRSDHASSRGKSNLQLLQKKIKKRGFKVKARKGKESEKREEVRKNVEKVRNKFWWRWLSYVKGRWSGLRPTRTDQSPKPVPTSKRALQVTGESDASGMDVIEIPIEPGRRISKILIKPTKTGIKAMIAQCRTPIAGGAKWSLSDDTSWDGRTIGQSDSQLSENCARFGDRSTNWTRKVLKKGSEINGSKETLLTSALFIREDMDNVVESAVFIEPNLPNDYAEEKKSDDSSQRSVKMNKRHVSYRVVDERNEEIRRTIKTVSEPTWMERKEILHRQNLHDNINDLLEQFMFLEAEDVMGLTIPHSKPVQEKKAIPFCGGHVIKGISREVSPEILVNIKPFKEYLSDDCLTALGGSHPEDRQDRNRHQRSIADAVPAAKKTKGGPQKAEEVAEESDYAEVLRNYCGAGIESEWRKTGGVEKEMRRCSGDCEELGEVGGSEKEGTVCTIWGVCKTYRACRKAGREGTAQGIDCERGSRKETLDEVLDTLDDSNHGVLFQKNMAQFRKKISVMPRSDPRKANSRTADGKRARGAEESKKVKRGLNLLEMGKPIIECVVEESEEEEDRERKRKTAALSVWSAEAWPEAGKWQKLFVKRLALPEERNTVGGVLGTRTEEAMVKVVENAREVHSLVESNTCTVVHREKAARGQRAGEVQVVCWTGRMAGEKFEILAGEKVRMEGKLVSGAEEVYERGEWTEEAGRSMRFFSTATECFYMIQSPRFPSLQQLSEREPKDSEPLETPRGKGTRGRKSVLVHSEPPWGSRRRAVEILDTADCDYVAHIDGDGARPGTPRRRSSAPFFSEDCGGKEPRGNSPTDGFQVLYNNEGEGLNEEEEEMMKAASVRSLDDRKGNGSVKSEEVVGGPEVSHKNSNRFMKYKSSSSPRENIVQNEQSWQEHRTRRSLILLKEVERELQNCKKRRMSADKGMEMRRTGSALLEMHSSRLAQDGAFLQKNTSFGGEELKAKPARDQKTFDSRKTLLADSSGANMRKEVIAAFNSIKEIGACKGEAKGGNKRMSLVIMLSKK